MVDEIKEPTSVEAQPAAEQPKPFQWSLPELKKAWDAGEIDDDSALDVYTNLKLQGNLYDMSKADVELAVDQGKLTDAQVEKWAERKKHPFWWHTVDAAKGFATGTKNFIENMSEQYYALENWVTGGNVDPKFDPAAAPDAPEGGLGKFTAGTTEFMMAYGGASKALKATGAVQALMQTGKMAKLAEAAPKVAQFVQAAIEGTVAGAPADYVSFDIKDGRIADLMEEHGCLPEFLNFMTTDEDNPEALERFKNVVEGAFIGTAVEGIMLGAKLLRAGAKAKYNGMIDSLKLDIATDPKLSAAANEAYRQEMDQLGQTMKMESRKADRLEHFKKQIDNLETKGKEAVLEDHDVKQLEVLKDRVKRMEANMKAEKSDYRVRPVASEPTPGSTGKPNAQGPNMGTGTQKTARAFSLLNQATGDLAPKFDTDNLIEHMESAPDAQTIIRHVWDNAGKIIADAQGYQSHKATQVGSANYLKKLADVTGGNPDAVMNNMRNIYGEIQDATTKAHALYRTLETYADQVAKMCKQYTGATDEALRIVEHMKLLEELQAMAYGIRSESGRLLNMHNIKINKARFDFSEFKQIESLPGYIQENRESFEKIIKEFGTKKGTKDRLKFSRFIGKGGFMSWLLGYRQAQLLWNPVTHVINTTSQTGALGFRIAARTFGHMMDAAVHLDWERTGALAKEMAGYFQALKVCFKANPKKAVAAHKAIRAANPGMSFKDAIMKNPEIGTFYRATFGREGIIDPGVKFKDAGAMSAWFATTPLGKIGRFIDAGLKLPFNALAGVDEVFKTLGTQSEYYSLIYREGLAQKRAGVIKDVDAFFKQEASKGRPDIFNKALNVGKELTFQDDLTGAAKKINEALNSGAAPMAARLMFIPFYKTTVNLVKWAAQNSALGFASKRVRDNLLSGGVEMWETIARMGMGSAAMGWAWMMYEDGKITGRLPADQRATLQAAGVQEYSKYDEETGKWVSYRRSDPFGLWLAFMADFHLAMDTYDQYQNHPELETEFEDVLAAAMATFTEPVVNATWMKGAKDAFEFIGEPDKSKHKFKQLALRQAGSLIPGATALDYYQSEFGPDDYYRELNTMMDVLWAKLDPSKLLPKRDVLYGTPVEKEQRWLHGVRQMTMTDDPAKLALVENGVKLSKLRDSLEFEGERVKITPELVDQYGDLISKLPLQDTLNKIVQDPGFQSMKDAKTKGAILKSVINEFRDVAKKQLIAGNPEITDEVITKLQRKVDGIVGLRVNPDRTAALYRWVQSNRED